MGAWRNEHYQDGTVIAKMSPHAGCTASVATSDHFKRGSRGKGRGKFTWVAVGFGYKPKVKRGKATSITRGKKAATRALKTVCRRK